MGDLTIGRMIWLKQVMDPQGDLKGPHAAIVLTSKDELNQGKPIKAVVISSQLHGLSEDQMVRLRHQRGGHPQTGLNRPSAAIGHWVVDVPNGDIDKVGSLVFGEVLVNVIQCVNRAKAVALKQASQTTAVAQISTQPQIRKSTGPSTHS